MKTIQGFMLIEVDVAALNNAGSDPSSKLDNGVVTKKIRKNNREYPYVSGQAWRYWWRETLVHQFKWVMSPVIREKKIAFTEAEPMKYPDDDIFGYMRAGTKEVEDLKTKKVKKENITLTRVSPLKNSALIGVAYNPIVQNWASMTRQDGDAVPFGIDEYCAVMKGMFSLNLDMVGRFSEQNRTGYVNINEEMRKKYLEEGAILVDDPIAKDKKGNPIKLVELPKVLRLKRIQETLSALKTLSGGAKQTTNLADVTPKLIVLAEFKTGNHPFSHLAKEEKGIPVFSVNALIEVIEDYQEQFSGKVFIGKRKGFMDDLDDQLQELSEAGRIEFGPVNKIIDSFIETISLD
ncbi:MAG: type I-B CRISPR-associated protein Cas7/Cst2/DevR [Candidatus Cloacimonetes bacterium]|nr:type I-B CRISPR-associated protein Cas7/Cst2/DevR [Candidatus Cloacimonadota bacterium]